MLQLEMNPFILLERGDDLGELAVDRRREKFRIAIPGQAFYIVNSCIPVVKVGGTILGIGTILEVSTSVSATGNVMTYVTFSLTQISKEYQKAFKMLYQMQMNSAPVDMDDRYSSSEDTFIPGAITPEALERISGTKSPKTTSETKSQLRRKMPEESSLSSLESARDFAGMSNRYSDDDDDVDDRNRRRRLWTDL